MPHKNGMKQLLTFFTYCLVINTALAQKENFDIVTCTPPKGWKKELLKDAVNYYNTNEKKKTWCKISIYKSIPGKGGIDADFNSEWEAIAKPLGTGTPQQSDIIDSEGWKMKNGAAKFSFNNADAVASLTTISGNNVCVSIMATTNSQEYMGAIQNFLNSVTLIKPAIPLQQKTTATQPDANTGKKSSFTFTTTNFDDGWSSTVKEDWVEVTKGGIKVLLHYPNKKADAYNAVLKEGDYTAWNTLVAPRYSNMKNFEWKTLQSYESISFMEADATENASGKMVHIVLFKKHYSNGNGRYLEFITDSKASYENEFGAYHAESYGWDKPAAMQYRNKFSVAANDLIGKWSTSDYASVSYYYVNTGGSAGTVSTATADEFTFSAGNNYQSQHSGASGMVGNMKFSNQVYKGKSEVTNWAITLTNRFEGATEKYDAYFEAIKGGRVLLMTDRLKTTHALVKQ
jgi:hypothetical protein